MNWKRIAIACAVSTTLPLTVAQAEVTIIVSNNQQVVTRGAGMSLDRMLNTRRVYGDRFIWTERDGKKYLITDQATIDAVLKVYEPTHEEKVAQKALETRERELSRLERALDREEEVLDEKLDDLEEEAENGRSVEAEMKQLEAQKKSLESRQRELEKQSRQLDEEDRRLDIERDRAEELADKQADELIDAAIRAKLASSPRR